MKHLLLFLCLPIIMFGRPLTAIEQKKVVTQIREVVAELETDLDDALRDLEEVKKELTNTQIAQATAQANVDKHQKEVAEVTLWGNKQATDKDKAFEERDYWKQKHDEALKKLWWWRILAIGITSFGIIYFLLPIVIRVIKPI